MYYNKELNKIIITNDFIKNNCYYKDNYNYLYWRDALKVGYYKGEILTQYKFSDFELDLVLEDLTICECLGIYQYFYRYPNYKQLWDKILKFNPYKGDLIHNAYFTFFENKNKLLSNDIKNYPTQICILIKTLSIYESDDDYDNINRLKIIETLKEYLKNKYIIY
jgi:hypothetical protein